MNSRTHIISAIIVGCLYSSIFSCSTHDLHARNVRMSSNPNEYDEDTQIAAYLSSRIELKALRNSVDLAEWTRHFWAQHDPSPETEINEALEVYRQRCTYLKTRFPGIVLEELDEPWVLFLELGLWDQRYSKDLTFGRGLTNILSGGRHSAQRGTDVIISDPAMEILEYRLNKERTFHISKGHRLFGTSRGLEEVPSLESCHLALFDINSTDNEKSVALEALTFYELPECAQLLLDVSPQWVKSIETKYQEACYRIARRMTYRFDTDSSQRLAALIATGADPRLILRRIIVNDYPEDTFEQDIWRNQESVSISTDTINPHPSLLYDPSQLINSLGERFPDTGSFLKWTWLAEIYLANGPPTFAEINNRIIHYLFPTPITFGVRYAFSGQADTEVLNRPIEDFIDITLDQFRRRRSVGREARTRISGVLNRHRSEEPGVVDSSILQQLNIIAPFDTYTLEMPSGVQTIPITADAVAIPGYEGNYDLLVSAGIAATHLDLNSDATIPQILPVHIVCTVFDIDGLEVHQFRHDGLKVVGKVSKNLEGALIVDGFRFEVAPGDYILSISCLDLRTERSGNVLLALRLEEPSNRITDLNVSPIMIANRVSPDATDGLFIVGSDAIIPFPGRVIHYGGDLWIHFDISNLVKSEFNDYQWREQYFIIPVQEGAGIISFDQIIPYTTIQSKVSRSSIFDLDALQRSGYEGDVFIVVLVTDEISNNMSLSATRFSLTQLPDGN